MKFATSKYAMRYDALWNDRVVSADTQIKAIIKAMLSRKGTDKQAFIDAIGWYAINVKNIVNNLVRQLTYFEDKENALRYLLSTIDSVHNDFDEYRKELEPTIGSDFDGLALLDNVKQELNVSINKLLNDSVHSGAELCDFDSYEERYNLMWNNEVVLADSKIRKMLISNQGFFKPDAESCASEIRHYITVIHNIVDDLVEHFGNFDKKLNASQYLMSTIKSVNDDLGAYRSALIRLVGRDFPSVKLIDDMKRELELSARYLLIIPESSIVTQISDDMVSVMASNESLESLEESGTDDYSAVCEDDSSQDFSEPELELSFTQDDSFWGEWPQELEDRACASSSIF